MKMEAELTCETSMMDEDKKRKETVSEYNTPLSKHYRSEINFN